MTNPTTSRLQVTTLADVLPEPVTWLWPGRLPAGKLVTLDGDPSLGKSTLSLALAAVVTTGGTWPDGTACHHPGAVILLAAEDGLADTVRPRLDAAGADCTQVHAVEGVRLTDAETGETYLRAPDLADVDQLHDLVVTTGARLLVIDVLMAYLPSGTDSHRDQDIRRVLSRLAAMADATGCCVLLLRHLNKAKGGDPMYRGGGSIGIVGAARAGLLVAADPDDDTVRVLASVKSNLGPAPAALTYCLTDADHHGVARVQWLGTSTHDARALLAEPDARSDAPDRDAAAAWLADYLDQEGRVPAHEVKAAARREGHTERTVQRAAASLGVVYEQDGFPRRTYWSAPPSRASDADTAPSSENRGATGDGGATGADLHVSTATPGLAAQSRQSRHGSESRRGCTVCGLPLTDATALSTGRCSRLDANHRAAS